MKVLKRIHTFIPGFRQLSSNSMIIAATYYGAAIFVLLNYWHWGLALLAAPFLIFNLLDLNAARGGRFTLASAIAAGLIVLLGTATGLSLGGMPASPGGSPPAAVFTAEPTACAAPAATASPKVSIAPAITAPPKASATPAASASLAPTPSPAAIAAADKAHYAYVSVKGSGVFHRPGCSYLKKTPPEDLIGFATRADALAAGLHPCTRCKP